MKLAPFVILQKNADGTGIVLRPDTFRGINLNRTGTFICNALDGRDVELDALIEAFAAEFQLDTATAERDVKMFLSLLQEKSLVRS